MDQFKITSQSRIEQLLGKAAFEVEHALGMYAISYCIIPAEGIYDEEALAPLMDVIRSCHIYLIGYTPIIDIIGAEQNGGQLVIKLSMLGKEHAVTYDIGDKLFLKKEGDHHFLEDDSGQRYWPTELDIQRRFSSKSKAVTFEVKYVGQAYGQGGSRNAIDRLLKHETLQKIALKQAPAGYRLTLLLLAIQTDNQVFTSFNPFAKNRDDGDSRIKNGLNKLFNTTEQERIALYEAALIRYFYPEFNKEFKDSFPSTNLKILQDCYEKDFSAVIAEIYIDELPFRLYSSIAAPAIHHIAKHDLHKDEDRRIFFGL